MKVLAIIQARMGSTRLPGKVLLEIQKMPLLEILIKRVECSKLVDQIVVATTESKDDDILCEWLTNKKIDYFRGSEKNVLNRFWNCAKLYDGEIIVRITADDPLKDSNIIDQAIKIIQSSENIDYVSNTVNPSFPEGLDVEIFTFSALDKANSDAILNSEKEHVTPYIWKNKTKFSIINFSMSPDLSSWRWTVDKFEDFKFIKAILKLADNNILISYKDVIKIIDDNQHLMDINSNTIRNEGYIKSINKENNQ